MPSAREIAAAEKAVRDAAPGMGTFSARVLVKAALEAAEAVREEQLRPPRPAPVSD